MIKAIKSFVIESLNCLAPYTVINSHFRKQHFCWTAGSAIAWAQCYDVEMFGETNIYNFNGEKIASFK